MADGSVQYQRIVTRQQIEQMAETYKTLDRLAKDIFELELFLREQCQAELKDGNAIDVAIELLRKPR